MTVREDAWRHDDDGTIIHTCLSFADPFKPFIIFSNRHEIRRIDLQKGDYSVLVPGLRNTIALDFHLNQSSLYWTDVVEDKIYQGKLHENGGECEMTTVIGSWEPLYPPQIFSAKPLFKSFLQSLCSYLFRKASNLFCKTFVPMLSSSSLL